MIEQVRDRESSQGEPPKLDGAAVLSPMGVDERLRQVIDLADRLPSDVS